MCMTTPADSRKSQLITQILLAPVPLRAEHFKAVFHSGVPPWPETRLYASPTASPTHQIGKM